LRAATFVLASLVLKRSRGPARSVTPTLARGCHHHAATTSKLRVYHHPCTSRSSLEGVLAAFRFGRRLSAL
jgi:hypothetical protein